MTSVASVTGISLLRFKLEMTSLGAEQSATSRLGVVNGQRKVKMPFEDIKSPNEGKCHPLLDGLPSRIRYAVWI